MSGERYAPAERLMALGFFLSESRGGRTVTEMAEHLGVSRRTVERMRASLDRAIGGVLEERVDDDGQKRWRLPTARLTAFITPTANELAALSLAARQMRLNGQTGEADCLDQLGAKLDGLLPRGVLRRYEPDIETLLEATGLLARPGPRPDRNPQAMDSLQSAILAGKQVRLTYRLRDGGGITHPRLHPYGFLVGSRGYLVGFNTHPAVQEHRVYALPNIEAVDVLEQTFARNPEFSLDKFAARSFGVFWDGKAFDVEWRFAPEVADDVRDFRFHPDQKLTEHCDGSTTVSFHASGLNEMAWHMFTWGSSVEILKPAELKQRYCKLLQCALARFPREVRPLWNDGTI